MGHVSPSTQADNMHAPGERGRRSSMVGQTLIGSVLSGTPRGHVGLRTLSAMAGTRIFSELFC